MLAWLLVAAFSPAIAAQDSAAPPSFPDVVDVTVKAKSGGTFSFYVTISSPYDSPQRYADAFRVMTPAGQVLGERPLAHPHADEQPFMRELLRVPVPPEVTTVVIQGRDSANGWGGQTLTAHLPARR